MSGPLRENDFGFLEFDLNFSEDDYPFLVLAAASETPSVLWPPRSEHDLGREWLLIRHQTRGYCCGQWFLVGTLLNPTAGMLQAMHEIAAFWYGTNVGCFEAGPTLDETITYRNQLRELIGVDCSRSHRHFEEAIYPIDLDAHSLRASCTDDIAINAIDPLAVSDLGFWAIYILGTNSD